MGCSGLMLGEIGKIGERDAKDMEGCQGDGDGKISGVLDRCQVKQGRSAEGMQKISCVKRCQEKKGSENWREVPMSGGDCWLDGRTKLVS